MSIFGSSGKSIDWYQSRQRKAATNASRNAIRLVNTDPASKVLTNASKQIGKGVGPNALTGDAGLGVKVNGNRVQLSRSDDAQNFINFLSDGLATDEAAYTDLLGQVAPGFGLVTAARRDALEREQSKSLSDLRGSLQRRRVSGSSFANDTIGSLNSEYAAKKAEADAQSFLDELSATSQLLEQRTASRTKSIEDGLSQLNFESQLGAELLTSVRQQNLTQNAILADLAKANAAIKAHGAEVRGTLVTQSKLPAIQNYADYASLASQERAGAGSALGSIAGTIFGSIGGPIGSAIGSKIGSSLFGEAGAP